MYGDLLLPSSRSSSVLPDLSGAMGAYYTSRTMNFEKPLSRDHNLPSTAKDVNLQNLVSVVSFKRFFHPIRMLVTLLIVTACFV